MPMRKRNIFQLLSIVHSLKVPTIQLNKKVSERSAFATQINYRGLDEPLEETESKNSRVR
jgi:hypothetical protein